MLHIKSKGRKLYLVFHKETDLTPMLGTVIHIYVLACLKCNYNLANKLDLVWGIYIKMIKLIDIDKDNKILKIAVQFASFAILA